MQCDFDTIGTLSVAADIETALVIHDLMRAIGFEKFQIRVNNRMVLNGLLEKLGPGRTGRWPILRALDKLGKAGREEVAAEMTETSPARSAQQAGEVLRLAELEGSNDEVLRQLDPLVAGSEAGQPGVADWRTC